MDPTVLNNNVPEGHITTFTSSLAITQERNLETIHHELTAIVNSVETYEFPLTDPKFPITISTVPRLLVLLYHFTGRSNVDRRIWRYEIQNTKFN